MLSGSPAIDTGNTALTTDQRGISRPQNTADDIGAYEARQNFSVLGLVRTNTLTPISGVAVALSAYPGGPILDTANTNSSGACNFAAMLEGYYTLAATKTGYTFTPPAQSLRVSTTNRAANFIAVPNGVAVSGRVMTNSGTGISGVTVTTDTGQTATTNTSGYYTLIGVPDGSRTLTPAKPAISSRPRRRTS